MSDHQQIIDGLSAYKHEFYKITDWASDSSSPDESSREQVETAQEADVIASSIKGEPFNHTIMLDLDVPAKLFPSSRPGHSHLYIDVKVSHQGYARILDALQSAGVIELGFARQLRRRGFTALRLPWVKKQNKEEAPF